jgi:hypothetical protein
MVWSGGGEGWHGYFAWPSCEVRNRNLGNIEIRGDRLLCMLPPSKHPSGKRYSWPWIGHQATLSRRRYQVLWLSS